MKFFIVLLSTIGFSTSSFAALMFTNCKNQNNAVASSISFTLVPGLHDDTGITYKDGAKTYKGDGSAIETSTSDRNTYNNEIAVEGSVSESQTSPPKSSATSKLKIDMRIFTAKENKGTAKIEMYKPKSKVLLCTQTE